MRWLALTDDPTDGGTRLDDVAGLTPPGIPAPALADAVVVTTAQADPGIRNLDRDNDVRGTRANSAPISFASAPSMTFTARAWTSLLRRLLPKTMGGAVASTGVAPAAIESTVQMLQDQRGVLPAMIGTLVREDQVDRMTGLWANEVTLNFPADEEGTVEGTLMGLYHDVDDVDNVAGLPAISGAPNQSVAYMLRDVTAFLGAGAGVQIDCLGGFGLTLNNNLSDDFRTRFCAGRNIYSVTIDGVEHRLWYPDRNRVGPQAITGRLDFGDTRPDLEAKRLVTHADQLIVELAADPLGTTPPADEMIRLLLHNMAPTGGGAEPLQRDGDQQSSYEFTAYVDDVTGKDLEATLVGTAAIAGP